MQLTENQVNQINDIINSELEEGFADVIKAGVKKILPAGKRVLSNEERAANIATSRARTAKIKDEMAVRQAANKAHADVSGNWLKAGPDRGTVNASTEYMGNLKVTENKSYQQAKENIMSFISEFYVQELESREAGIKGMNDESLPIKTKGSATSNPKDTTSGDGAFVAGTMKFPKGNMVSGDLGKGNESDHDDINGQRAGVRSPSQMASAAMKGLFA